MSEVAQDSDVVVADEPALNQAETQDDKSKPAEATTNDNDAQSPEVEVEVEKSPEEVLAETQKLNEQMQKKIDRQTAAYTALQKTHQQRQQEFEAIQSKIQTEAPQEPKIDDFETFEDFDKARVDFISKQAEQTAQKKLIEQQQEQQKAALAQERTRLVAEQESEFLASNPNYAASKQEFNSFIGSMNVNPATENAIVEQSFKGNVPQIIDYFGANNGENIGKLQEISQMNAIDAAIEIYKIQQSLKAPALKENKPLPKPLNKPKGQGAPKKDLSEGDVLKNLGLK